MENIKEKIKKIKILLLDVDGVLTDGSIIFDSDGRELKFFNVKDGHGIKMLQRGEIEVGIITGRNSKPVEARAKDLNISILYQGALNKVGIFNKIKNEKKVADAEIAYMGDDIVDLPVLKMAGFSAAPSDCSKELKKKVDYIAKAKGGKGAVREVAELILKSQSKWEGLTKRYK